MVVAVFSTFIITVIIVTVVMIMIVVVVVVVVVVVLVVVVLSIPLPRKDGHCFVIFDRAPSMFGASPRALDGAMLYWNSNIIHEQIVFCA